MKIAVAALLAGVAVAKHDDAANALKIQVSPWGQKKIEKEAKDVRRVAHRIKNAPATKSLKGALMKWAHSKAAMKVRALDRKFLASPAGKKLIKEWKDVGRVLKNNTIHTKNGLHFNNKAVNKLSNELDDVSDHYEYLGTTHWDAKYKLAYKNLFTSKAFQKVKWAAGNFKKAPAGKMLKKEVMELGGAIKKHVKVTDVPQKWKRAMHGLRVEVDQAGQKAIKDEADDVAEWWQHTENRPVTVGLKKHLMKWGSSDEAHKLMKLDAQFKASPEGQKLMAEWKEFGEHLKKAIKPTGKGIHIDNKELDIAEDNLEDIEDQYKALEKTHWSNDFEQGFNKLFHNDEAKALEAYVNQKWKPSREAKRGKKEIMELGKAIHDNVEVSDIPQHWQDEWKEMDDMPHYQLLATTDGLERGEALGPRTGASYITSINNIYRLQVQNDGNVVIYKSFNAWANSHPIWSLAKVNPAGVADPRLVHQTDGNLCLYWNGQHQWSTGTHGKITTRLVMQGDGNLVLYWGANPLWSSGTVGK